jgi:hypothetical protein
VPEKTIGETLSEVFSRYDPQHAVPKSRKPAHEDYWRGLLSDHGSTTKPTPTLGSLLGDAISAAAKKTGASERTAQRVSRRAMAFASDATPVGNALMAEEGGKQVKRGLTQGDLKQAAIGAGIFGLSMLPFGANARKSLNALMPDDAGALFRGWHGSPNPKLNRILADPPARQFDNATSQFGAFLAPNETGAARYAGQMDWGDFARFQAPNIGADGSRLPGEMWERRALELKQEAAELRARLAAQGYDGIVIRGPRGDIKEIASFRDIPLPQ